MQLAPKPLLTARQTVRSRRVLLRRVAAASEEPPPQKQNKTALRQPEALPLISSN